MRCFISLDAPFELKNYVKDIQSSLAYFTGKKVEQDNLHLTLKLLGEINLEELENIKLKLREIKLKKFSAKIDSIGVFGEDLIKIIWLKIDGVDELQKLIDNSLRELFSLEKRFMSHLTIARVKSVEDKKDFLDKLENLNISKMEFIVDKFKIKKSILNKSGSFYEDIEVYYLH